MTQTWPFKVLWKLLCNLIDICCWWVWVIWTVDRDVIAYFSQYYFYRVEIVIEKIWCCLQSWSRATYEEVPKLAIEPIKLGMPGLSERSGKSFCWNIASLIKKLPLASFGCYEKGVGYMPLILCLSGCMCHKQSAFCYRFSMLSTGKCECPYFVWKWVRWLQGAITKGNCVSCKILIWNSPLQAESAMAALNCSGAILGSLPIRWASPCLQRIQFLLSLSISAPDKFEVYIYFCISKAHWSHLCSVQGESIKDTCKASVSTASSALIDQIFQQFLEHLVSKYVQSLSWPVCFAHRSRLMFCHAFQTVQHAGETW